MLGETLKSTSFFFLALGNASLLDNRNSVFRLSERNSKNNNKKIMIRNSWCPLKYILFISDQSVQPTGKEITEQVPIYNPFSTSMGRMTNHRITQELQAKACRALAGM